MASEHDSKGPEKKNASEDEKKLVQVQRTITASSPYYLGTSDNPGTPLVAVPLKGENYRNWARSMKTALWAKTKLGFIDGTIEKPSRTSADYLDWERVDSMVVAWIINSTDPSLHGSISHATTARDVWLDLEERFAQTNAPRIHQLWRALCLIQQQPGITVTEYYTKFKSLIDELSELLPLLECTCGASKELARREEDHRVHLFLGGLDGDGYGHVKASILNTDPLPSLRRAFNHTLREESRVMTERSRDVKPEVGAAFYSNKHKTKDGARPKCDHCGKIGHEKSKCFEIVGYPPHWDTRRTNRNVTRGHSNSGGARLALVDNNQSAGQEGSANSLAFHGSHMNRADDQHEHMSGNKLILSSCNWVLDSGASHHMTPLYHLLRDVCDLEEPLHISVPTRNVVSVKKKGDRDP